jgi:Barstar (barnase inhibitor)
VSEDLQWSDLAQSTGSRIWGLTTTEAELEKFIWSAPRRDDMVVRVLRGSRCGSPAGLFQEWGAALQFPYYYGHNWAALDECLEDLEWLPARRYVFFLTEFQDVLAASDADLRSYVRLLQHAVTSPAEGGGASDAQPDGSPDDRVMTFVLQSPSQHADAVSTRLRNAGLELWSWRSLRLQ